MRDPILTIFNLIYYQMGGMFNGVAAFNQDLCHFKDNSIPNFLMSSVVDMFQGTDCPDTSDPQSASGPWCVNPYILGDTC